MTSTNVFSGNFAGKPSSRYFSDAICFGYLLENSSCYFVSGCLGTSVTKAKQGCCSF